MQIVSSLGFSTFLLKAQPPYKPYPTQFCSFQTPYSFLRYSFLQGYMCIFQTHTCHSYTHYNVNCTNLTSLRHHMPEVGAIIWLINL
jgi:hypothetical protein